MSQKRWRIEENRILRSYYGFLSRTGWVLMFGVKNEKKEIASISNA